MNYEEFKTKVIEIYETKSAGLAYGLCRDLISNIDLDENDKRIIETYKHGDESWAKRMVKRDQERYFDKWMASLKEERGAACRRHDAALKAAWDAKTPEEKAVCEEAERKFQKKCKMAVAAALDEYYEEAARTGRYTGD